MLAALGLYPLARRASGDDRHAAFGMIKAHIGLSRHAHREGRAAWNAAFAVDGLAPPLDMSDDPVSADGFSSAPTDPRTGPTVSVIVPYRDAAATLGHALESLCAQSWRDLEILAIDDGSTDAGPGIAARAAQRDRRVICLRNEGKQGVYGARNRALEQARGEYVTFLDADDWSPPERIERQLAALAAGAAVSIANHVRIDERGRPVAPRVFPLARPVPITMMIRREVLHAAGPFEEVVTGADSEMLGRLRMRFGRKSIARDPAILLVARWRAGSLSEAREGGLFGEERLAYRADWMFRHAGRRLPDFGGAA
ncbi:MAG: glycosyltransferase family 2 protein [Sphingomonadales bacterium]|nr:glycosyltransferase family 2 protein [Sphingomonadales bacterium]